jgi:hypothetical protein
MKLIFPRPFRSFITQIVSLVIASCLFAAPLCAQRPAPPRPAAQPEARLGDPAFDNLLSADSYKLYGEIRNVGQLMSTGGAGEIIDPILKLADPPKEFRAIIKFLKTNAEALSSSRLLFATWPARTEIPMAFVAIEFPSPEDAAKFAPKLETFLPGILPPVPVTTPEETLPDRDKDKSAETGRQQTSPAKPETAASPQPSVERPAFVLSHTGNLVFISDKPFKLEKLRGSGSKLLAEDQNFRVAHDRFSTEPVFLYFNVALEERNKPKPQDAEIAAQAEAERLRMEEEANDRNEAEVEITRDQAKDPQATPSAEGETQQRTAVLTAEPMASVGEAQASPTPTPTKQQEAQRIASSQISNLLDPLGYGEPQWPEAIGVALALDNNDYVIRAILVEPPDAKKLPLPFLPQLISGPAATAEAPTVLPEGTEVFVSVSVDFAKTFEGMRKEADIKAKTAQKMAGGAETPPDLFIEFEKKSGFKIKEDFVPVLGNEIAFAGSLSALQGLGPFNMQPPKTSPSSNDKKDQEKKNEAFPMLLIAIKDREGARRLMPHVLDGLGIGEANLIAQAQKREDVDIVNYAGFFAYAFVGNFLVISDAATVNKTIDAYLNRRTLGSNNTFRNSRRWEPRQNLGEIYISPALMEGYHDEVRKQAANLDPALRDYILGLDPTSSAITYALSNEGLGTQHEIRLPKNLIITTVAGITSAMKNPPPETNEMIAISMLRMIAGAESTYQSTKGKGKYGTLDNLVAEKLISTEYFEKYGYNVELTASGDHFEAVATPREYGKTGKRSFFIDQTGVLRGDDHGGGPATISDKPIE